MLEYNLIKDYYGDRCATRSGVRLMNHIDEGLIILNGLKATYFARKAFCLHPLLQNDSDLVANYTRVALNCDSYTVMLAMEYRSVANEYLSDKVGRVDKIRLSPLAEVNDMLRADKIQNYKDFCLYHKGTHPRSAELEEYFLSWFEVLGVRNVCDYLSEA